MSFLRKVIFILVTLYICCYVPAFAFVGGGSFGGGGHGGFGSSHSYTAHNASYHNSKGSIDNVDMIIIIIVLLMFVCMIAGFFYQFLITYVDTPYLNALFEKRQKRALAKCRFPTATSMICYAEYELATARQFVEKDALSTLNSIQYFCHGWKDLKKLKEEGIKLFIEFEKAWSNKDLMELYFLCSGEEYYFQLMNQIENFNRLKIINYIKNTRVTEVTLLSVKHDRFSSQSTGNIIVKGDHIDEYMTQEECEDLQNNHFEPREFNAVLHFDISNNTIKMRGVTFDKHVDDILMARYRKLLKDAKI